MLKTYQFKTHCKGNSHSFKTANIILPELMIKQRWISLCLQAKFYSNSFNCIMLVEKTHLTQVEYCISLADIRHSPLFYHRPGKMIFAVLELW